MSWPCYRRTKSWAPTDSYPGRGDTERSKVALWRRWVGVNALAELVGLGATLGLDLLIITQVAAAGTWLASVLAFGRGGPLALSLLVIALGLLVAGAVVGAVHGLAPLRLAARAER